jgi:hypothetical protein
MVSDVTTAREGMRNDLRRWVAKPLTTGKSHAFNATSILRIDCATTELPRPLIIQDLFSRFKPCVQLAFQPIRVSPVRYLTFDHECGTSPEPISAPLIADNRVSTFHHALTFPEAKFRKRERSRPKLGCSRSRLPP